MKNIKPTLSRKDCYEVLKECYLCILEAENDSGPIEKEDGFAPKFIKQLLDQAAVCGTPAALSVEVDGKPDPDVSWTVDDEEIFEDEGIAFTQDGQVHSLVFKETVEEDEGVYKCIARNSHGEVESSAKFVITDEAVKPEFVQVLKHVEVKEMCEARFQVEVAGSPIPDVTWLKRKVVLVESDKYKITRDGLNVTLIILDCSKDDVGVYQAVAENSAGKVSCNAQLTVVKSIEPPSIETAKDLPSKFTLKSGEKFFLEFAINGEVTEKYWMCNGKELEENDRMKIKYEKDKVTFVIEFVEESDGGVYEFVASNSSGKAVNTITLNVEGEFSPSLIF